jgi:hypothetical protein
MVDTWNSAIRAAIPAIVALAFMAFRRHFPARSSRALTKSDLKEVSTFSWVLAVVMLGVALAFGIVVFYCFLWANQFLATRAEAVFIILPTHWMWLGFPLFSSLCFSCEITIRLWEKFGNISRIKKYLNWADGQAGFDSRRIMRFIIMFACVPAGIANLLALPIHTSFTDFGLRVGHYGVLHTTYHPYSDVSRIVVTDGIRLRDGSLSRNPAIVLYFSDGGTWSSTDNGETSGSINEALLNFIQRKTRLPIERVEALPFGSR